VAKAIKMKKLKVIKWTGTLVIALSYLACLFAKNPYVAQGPLLASYVLAYSGVMINFYYTVRKITWESVLRKTLQRLLLIITFLVSASINWGFFFGYEYSIITISYETMVVVADIFGICSIISLFFYFILEAYDEIVTLEIATNFLDIIEDDIQSYDDEDLSIDQLHHHQIYNDYEVFPIENSHM
jgi:hypothetical protein